MAKKAFLVDFSVRTRVVVNLPERKKETTELNDNDVDIIASAARDKILSDAKDYICPDNLTEINEDFECPYGTFSKD